MPALVGNALPIAPVVSMAAANWPLAQTEWRPHPSDSTGTCFVVDRVDSDESAEIHLLPHLSNRGPLQQSLIEQIRLVKLLRSNVAPRLLDFQFDVPVPRLAIELLPSQTLAQFLVDCTAESLLRVAADMLDQIQHAQQVGLRHGLLTLDAVRITHAPTERALLDFFQRFYSASQNTSASALEMADDKLALSRLLAQIFGSPNDSDCAPESLIAPSARCSSSAPESPIRCQTAAPESHNNCLDRYEQLAQLFTSRKRALLKVLIRNSNKQDATDDCFEQWRELLSEWLPEPAVVTSIATASCEPSALKRVPSDDQTRELCAPTNTRASTTSGLSADQTFETPSESMSGRNSQAAGETPARVDTNGGIPQPQPGDVLGRFQLEHLIGQGGMGTVFRARDLASQETVAVKVLRIGSGDISQAVRRFNKEAKLLAQIQNSYVTRLIDVGISQGQHYLAMEFVEGTNLKQWLQSVGSTDEKTALRIVGDVARGLVDAHQQQIVHRDIKPENILLAHCASGQLDTRLEPADTTRVSLTNYCIKLSDFGIARHVQQSQSMEVTRAGSLLGSPLYMSPEQCKGTQDASTTSDIYSLGITLYELLCGQPPFESSDPMKLAAMHCFDAPPSLRKRMSSSGHSCLSDATESLLARMLAKKPSDRFTDAAQVVRETERILNGQASDVDAHPRLPSLHKGEPWQRVFQWDLQSECSELWPLVANTDRVNRAANLPSVEYHTEKDPQLGLRKFGSFRMAGLQIRWEEHPYEWIEGSRMGVLREFSSGPFHWFTSTLELKAKATGGTLLIQTVRILPRNPLGRVLSTIEAGWKGGRALARIYRHIDATLQKRKNTSTTQDPFELPLSLSHLQKKRIQQRLEQLISAGASLEAAQKLSDYIETAAPQALAKIRPLELAHLLQLPQDQAVDICLLAAHCDLLTLGWDILCPTCRVAATTEKTLASIGQHTTCEACDTEFQSNLGNAIEMVFRAHPDIREVDDALYCTGGPFHAPHVLMQLRLEPQERIELAVQLTPGEYILRSTRLAQQYSLRAVDAAAPSQLDARLSQFGATDHTPTVRSGNLSLCLTNDSASRQLIRIERTTQRALVVTATMASALPRFRELFPEQTFRSEMPVATEQLTLLSAQLSNGPELYATVDDATAYGLTHLLLSELERCVAEHGGAVVKTTGEGLLASFQNTLNGTHCAVDMLQRVETNDQLSQLRLGIAVHRGRTLVSTQNGRLDYFGSATRLVQAIAAQTHDAISLTDAVFTDPGAQSVIDHRLFHSQFSAFTQSGSSSHTLQTLTSTRIQSTCNL